MLLAVSYTVRIVGLFVFVLHAMYVVFVFFIVPSCYIACVFSDSALCAASVSNKVEVELSYD